MRVLGTQNTLKTIESLLGSGYAVSVQVDNIEYDADNIWRIKNFIVEYEEEKLNFFPSSLDQLFKFSKNYDAPSLEYLLDDWDNFDLFDEMGVRKD